MALFRGRIKTEKVQAMNRFKKTNLGGIITGLSGASCTITAFIFAVLTYQAGELALADFLRYALVALFVTAFALFISIGLLLHKNHIAQIGGLSALVALPVAFIIYNTPFLIDLPDTFGRSWAYAMGSLFDFSAALVLAVAGGFLADAAGNKTGKAGKVTIKLTEVSSILFTIAFLFFLIADILSYGAYTPNLFGAAGTGLLSDSILAVLVVFFNQGASPENFPRA
jgi:hypothetical protein